jgi:hypothetical protein
MSELWRKSLRTLRDDFAFERQQRREIHHLLVETTLRSIRTLTEANWQRLGLNQPFVFASASIHNWPWWLDVPPDDQWRDELPVTSVEVTPLDVDFSPGSRVRQEIYFGEDCTAFRGLVAKASAVIKGIPTEELTQAGIADAQGHWTWALHSLGWECRPGSLLQASRWVWRGNNRVQFQPGDQFWRWLEQQRQINPLDSNAPVPPDRFYSSLGTETHRDDACAASIAAIDLLLDGNAGKAALLKQSSPALPLPSADIKSVLSKEALALAALVENPGWSDQQIANAAGCNRKSLYRMEKFRQAKRAMRSSVPGGQKDERDGTIEAWDEEKTE